MVAPGPTRASSSPSHARHDDRICSTYSSCGRVYEGGTAAAAGATGRRRGDDVARRAADSGPQRGAARALPEPLPTMPLPFAPHSSMQVHAPVFKAYDIRGVVGQALTAPSCAHRPRVRHAAPSAAGDTLVVGRDGRLSGPELAAALVAGIRAERRDVIDHRHGRDADELFRRATRAGRMQRHGHRQPQPARLQRPQDGDARRAISARTSRRCARASNRVTSQAARPQPRAMDIAAGLPRPHRRRRAARATDEDRRRLRQRRCRRFRRRCCSARLGCEVNELFCDGRRHVPQSPSRPVATEEPAGSHRAASPADDDELGLAFDGDGDRLGVVTTDGASSIRIAS